MCLQIKERKTQLSQLETLDNGKPITEAEADMDDAIATFEYYAGLGEKLETSREKGIDVGDDSYKTYTRSAQGVPAVLKTLVLRLPPARLAVQQTHASLHKILEAGVHAGRSRWG